MSGMSPWAMLGSARRDRSVVEQKVSRDTVRRIVGFALPHRSLIVWFLVLRGDRRRRSSWSTHC